MKVFDFDVATGLEKIDQLALVITRDLGASLGPLRERERRERSADAVDEPATQRGGRIVVVIALTLEAKDLSRGHTSEPEDEARDRVEVSESRDRKLEVTTRAEGRGAGPVNHNAARGGDRDLSTGSSDNGGGTEGVTIDEGSRVWVKN